MGVNDMKIEIEMELIDEPATEGTYRNRYIRVTMNGKYLMNWNVDWTDDEIAWGTMYDKGEMYDDIIIALNNKFFGKE